MILEDVVTRLRDWSSLVKGNPTLDDAVAEIERLRNFVGKVVDYGGDGWLSREARTLIAKDRQ